VAIGAHPADTTFDQAFKQERAGLGAAWTPLAVVLGDSGRGPELLVGDEGRAVDRDPFFAWASDLDGCAGPVRPR